MSVRELSALPDWQRKLAQPIHDAVFAAAVGMTDEEINAIVHAALIKARRALSS